MYDIRKVFVWQVKNIKNGIFIGCKLGIDTISGIWYNVLVKYVNRKGLKYIDMEVSI